LRRKEPELHARARHFCLPHDYLNLWLTGEFSSGPGDASGTAYFNVQTRSYSETVLRTLDADRDWEHSLPAISPSLSLIAGLRREGARRRPGLGAQPARNLAFTLAHRRPPQRRGRESRDSPEDPRQRWRR